MGKLSELPNIGAELERQLNDVGIFTAEELKSVGSREAWTRIYIYDPSACVNRLMALEGAIRGVRWHYLDAETKEELKEFYRNAKNQKG